MCCGSSRVVVVLYLNILNKLSKFLHLSIRHLSFTKHISAIIKKNTYEKEEKVQEENT